MLKYTNSSPENELKELLSKLKTEKNEEARIELKRQINLFKEIISDRKENITSNEVR